MDQPKFDYVAGFLFSENLLNVALIEKQKPVWQKGKLNAIGGKIEPNESPLLAMEREFFEETGLFIADWKAFCVLKGNSDESWRVHFFYAVGDTSKVKQIENEKPIVCSIANLQGFFAYGEVIPNLRWLIPMAKNFAKGNENCSGFSVIEIQQ